MLTPSSYSGEDDRVCPTYLIVLVLDHVQFAQQDHYAVQSAERTDPGLRNMLRLQLSAFLLLLEVDCQGICETGREVDDLNCGYLSNTALGEGPQLEPGLVASFLDVFEQSRRQPVRLGEVVHKHLSGD